MAAITRFAKSLTAVGFSYADESDQHTARGLIRMVWGVMIAMILSLFLSLFVLSPGTPQNAALRVGALYITRPHLFHIVAFVITTGATGLIVQAIRRGELRRACVTFVILLLAVVVLNYIPQRYDDPIVILFSLPLIAAGVLLRERDLRNTIVAILITLLVLLVLRMLGLTESLSRGSLGPEETFAYSALALIVSGLMISYFSGHQRLLLDRNLTLTADLRELNTALERSKAELQVANADLEKRVYERTEQLLLATQEAEKANQVKSAFLASMSHELRTPLNAIINFSKFLRNGVVGPLQDEQLELVVGITDSGEHLLNLINDVLDMSKIESGSLKLFVEPDLDVRDIIETAIRYTRPMLAEKPVELQQELPPSLPLMVGDRKRLLQIFLNILANACKFTDQGHVRVKAMTEDGQLLVSVEDTGRGIDPSDTENVFLPFRQTESGLRQGGGTGLGMPICRNLVTAHEGRLWFESQVGVGTTFFVSLPLQTSLEPARSK